MNRSALFDAIDANLQVTMRRFTLGSAKQTIVHHHGATLLLSSLSSSFFNHIIDCRLPEKNTLKIIREIHAQYHLKKVSFSWWLGPNHTPTNLRDFLKSEGLSHQASVNVMQIDLAKEYPQHFSPFSIIKISNLKQWQQFIALQALSRNSLELFGEIYDCASFDQNQESVAFYLGYLNDQPTTCGAITLHASVMQIHSLCTHPYYQHRGYARAMMQFLVHKGKEAEYRWAFLMSALEQSTFYEKLGFTPLTQYEEYAHSNI